MLMLILAGTPQAAGGGGNTSTTDKMRTLQSPSRSRVTAAALAMYAAGCGHAPNHEPTTPPPGSGVVRVALARECAELAKSHAANSRSYARVFVEVADVTHFQLTKYDADSLRGSLVERPSTRVGGTLAQNSRTASIPWSTCMEPTGKQCVERRRDAESQSRLEFVPLLPERASGLIKLNDVRIAQGSGSVEVSSGVNVATHDQRPVLVALTGTDSESVSRVAITPYLIGDDADLRLLLECRRATQ
jgi:hypothetical protein